MVDTFGAGLLRGIQEESFIELLSGLRATASLSSPSTGIAIVDDIIPALRHLNLSTLSYDTVGSEIRNDRPLEPPALEDHNRRNAPPKHVPPVLEVKATGSAEGQWQFLYRVVADMLLGCALKSSRIEENAMQRSRSRDYHSKSAGGLVVWIDCFRRFDIRQLYKIMLSMASKPSLEASEAGDHDAHSLVYAALDNLHVFSPETSGGLLATVRSLDSHLLSLQNQAAGDLSVRAIIISDITSFYWEDRQKEEDEKAANLGVPSRSEERSSPPLEDQPRPKRSMPFTISSHHASLTSSLSRLTKTFCCPLLLLTTCFYPMTFPQPLQDQGSLERRPALRSPLPSPWSRLVNIEMILQKQKMGKRIDRNVGLAEPLDAEQIQRLREDDIMKVKGWIDARKWIKASLSETLAEDEVGRLGTSKFEMRIGRADIEIGSDNR
ncbi:hypothetical protein MMC10_007935 [Thelotrema lepadinum]|nr:hypothetical protein [Thelotrema lepadinum]